LLPHPHLRPPPQMPPLGMPSSGSGSLPMPSSVPTSLSMPMVCF
jgi:polyadenylation factor subunit 2